jgi:AraC-like DNA-binding protein
VKRPKFVLFLILPWLIGIIAFFIVYTPEFVAWPSPIRKGFYSDSITKDKGNSGIRQLPSSPDILTFEYLLGDRYEFPYVGATFEFESDSVQRISDLSRYDYVEIELDAELSKRIPVVINQDIKGYSNPEIGASYRPLTRELVYEKGKRSYELRLSDFQTPAWWFTNTKLTEKEVGKPDLSRAHSVQLHNCQIVPKNTLERFSIYRIAFRKDMFPFWLLAVSLIVLYYICLFLILRFRKSIKRIFPRKQLEVGNVADEDSLKVLTYISENYSNAELSLELLQKELGLSESKISNVIKEAADMNFKRYLNTLRLEEAKRLLAGTDRQVMDIAYKVGYGNVTHFNRVFKEVEGCSPNEFRKVSSEKH